MFIDPPEDYQGQYLLLRGYFTVGEKQPPGNQEGLGFGLCMGGEASSSS